jgi:predicted PurR-regulated permease PerM
MNPQTPYDLTRITLVVLIIGVLLVGSLWTLLPFLGALIWSATIVVATWPLLLRIQRVAGDRRWIATAIMTGLMLAIFIVPFWFAIGELLAAAAEGVEMVRVFLAQGLAPPPEWIERLPWVGDRVAARWRELAASGPEAVTETVRPYVRSAATWVLSITGGFGIVIVHFILTVIIAAILYSQGESAARGVLMFARRIGRERGERVVRLAGQAVRGVAMGVIVTALVQSLFAGLGLWVSGVPRPGFLLAVTFVLGVTQLGPLPVLLPAVIWLYWSGSIGWASALLVWTVLVAALDNFLRPLLIRRGVDLPLLLIIPGVIGGLIGFGVVGLFIGPVILAVTYTLLESWIREDKGAAQ